MRYAMILNSVVIEILEAQEVEPQWPPSPQGVPVTAIECSASVQIGMRYENGTFLPALPQPLPEPTQLDRIEQYVATSQKEVAQEAVDTYTLQLMQEGLI